MKVTFDCNNYDFFTFVAPTISIDVSKALNFRQETELNNTSPTLGFVSISEFTACVPFSAMKVGQLATLRSPEYVIGISFLPKGSNSSLGKPRISLSETSFFS